MRLLEFALRGAFQLSVYLLVEMHSVVTNVAIWTQLTNHSVSLTALSETPFEDVVLMHEPYSSA